MMGYFIICLDVWGFINVIVLWKEMFEVSYFDDWVSNRVSLVIEFIIESFTWLLIDI